MSRVELKKIKRGTSLHRVTVSGEVRTLVVRYEDVTCRTQKKSVVQVYGHPLVGVGVELVTQQVTCV